MSKIPCEVIRDLFPSYIDGLTSDVTNGVIDGHLAGCSDCRGILESMKEPAREEHTMSENEKKEIDFLKKNKKRNRRVLIASIAAALVLAVVVAGLKFFAADSEMASSNIAAKVKVDGSHLVIDGDIMDSIHGIKEVKFEEEDGVVNVRARAILRGIGKFHEEYDASESIKQVWLNGKVLWDDGSDISSYVSAVYSTRHDYMGDISANNRTAAALGMIEYLGEWTNELETSQQPYRWRIILSEPVESDRQMFIEHYMEAYAYILLGVIGNLDEVEYVYTAGGEQLSKVVTVSDASAYFAGDIKTCGSSPKALSRLIFSTGVNAAFPSVPDGASVVFVNGDEIVLKVVNDTDGSIYSVSYSVYKDDMLCSTHSAQNADNSPISAGHSLMIDILPEDAGGALEDGEQLYVSLDFCPSEDDMVELPSRIDISTDADEPHVIYITGSEKDGYTVNVIGQ